MEPMNLDVEKLYYLKSCLSEDAAGVIAGIKFSPENYEVAWNLLKDRYDKPKFIIQKHTKALLDLPTIGRNFSVRSFLNQIQQHLLNLKSLGEPVHQWNTLLIVIICRKMNNSLREKWEEYTLNMSSPTMDQMIDFLEHRAQVEDISAQVEVPAKHRSSRHTFGLAIKLQCAFCKASHSIYSCREFLKLSPNERFAAVKVNALCINCLRRSHKVIQCPSSNCRQCGSKHHTLLHFAKNI